MTTCKEYVISMDAENISGSSNAYLGRLRSNFFGNKYIIYDMQPPPYTSEHVHPPCRRLNSNKISPTKVPTRSYSIGQIIYGINVNGKQVESGPRKMQCVSHSIPVSALDAVAGQPELLTSSFADSICSISFSSKSSLGHSTEICSSRFSDIRSLSEEVDNKVKPPFVLKNKPPRWLEKQQSA